MVLRTGVGNMNLRSLYLAGLCGPEDQGWEHESLVPARLGHRHEESARGAKPNLVVMVHYGIFDFIVVYPDIRLSGLPVSFAGYRIPGKLLVVFRPFRKEEINR